LISKKSQIEANVGARFQKMWVTLGLLASQIPGARQTYYIPWAPVLSPDRKIMWVSDASSGFCYRAWHLAGSTAASDDLE
jgi:hypothetical protein